MKYILIDVKNGDMFDKEFSTREEAIKQADIEWNHLSKADKEHTEAFYILESVNPDEDAENHYDGNIVKDYLKEDKEC